MYDKIHYKLKKQKKNERKNNGSFIFFNYFYYFRSMADSCQCTAKTTANGSFKRTISYSPVSESA